MAMAMSTFAIPSPSPSAGLCRTPAYLSIRSFGSFSSRQTQSPYLTLASTSSSAVSASNSDIAKLDISNSSAYTVVEAFYDGINKRDLDSVRDVIAENCVYEDLIFPEPFVGRKAILEFFGKFTNAVGRDLQFAIDDINKDDPLCVGVTWHLEWRGKPFPFSKGCSFYRLNENQQIIYGRDIVEPAIKPGDAALVIIRGVAALFDRFPQLIDRF